MCILCSYYVLETYAVHVHLKESLANAPTIMRGVLGDFIVLRCQSMQHLLQVLRTACVSS